MYHLIELFAGVRTSLLFGNVETPLSVPSSLLLVLMGNGWVAAAAVAVADHDSNVLAGQKNCTIIAIIRLTIRFVRRRHTCSSKWKKTAECVSLATQIDRPQN